MSGLHADANEDRNTTRVFLNYKSPEVVARARDNPVLQKHLDTMIERLFEKCTITCRVRTLSEVILETGVNRIDLLKIDVEKSEHEVLAGIAELDWTKIRQIVIEVHDVSGRQAELKTMLEQRGYHVDVEQDTLLRTTNIFTLYGRRS